MMARPSEESPTRGVYEGLSFGALAVASALVLARATLLETLRDPFDVSPGALSFGRGPGAATSVLLNLLSFVPVALLLIRRALDRSYALRLGALDVCMIALGLWCAASVTWANDKFAAVIGASTWCAFLMLAWTFSQVIRTHLHARLMTGLLVGVLLIYVAQGMLHQFVELPALKQEFDRSKEQIFRDRGWTSDSFMARQFEKRVTAGQAQGFFASPNTFAAAIVLTMLCAIGAIVQRVVSRDEPTWPVILALIAIGGAWTLWLTGSRTGVGTLMIGVFALVAISVLFRKSISASRFIFLAGAIALFSLLVAIVIVGLSTGGLVHDSLTFRWNYWIASTQMFLDRPWLGTGWGGFGSEYLRYRLPEPSEEIKDPHNFLVRFACELGVPGLVLGTGLLFLLWREATRNRPNGDDVESSISVKGIALIAASGIALSCIAVIDFAQAIDGAAIELLKRLLYAGALFVAILLVALQSSARQQLDTRAAPILRYALLVAIFCFLVHNLVDFALFETGSMMLFALVAGSAVGIANPAPVRSSKSLAPLVALSATLLLLAAAAIVLVPIVAAEAKAHAADDLLRSDRASIASGQYRAAYDTLAVPNADYALREARALIFARADARAVRDALGRALAAEPTSIPALRTRALFERSLATPDVSAVRRDFDRILALDPRNISLILEYAEILEQLARGSDAQPIFERAVVENARMHPDNPRRNDRVVHERFGDFLARSGAFQLARTQYQLAMSYDDSLKPSDERKLPPRDRATLERKLIEVNRRATQN